MKNLPLFAINEDHNRHQYSSIIVVIAVGHDMITLLKHFTRDTDDMKVILMLFPMDSDNCYDYIGFDPEKYRNFWFIHISVVFDSDTIAVHHAHHTRCNKEHMITVCSINNIRAFVMFRTVLSCLIEILMSVVCGKEIQLYVGEIVFAQRLRIHSDDNVTQ